MSYGGGYRAQRVRGTGLKLLSLQDVGGYSWGGMGRNTLVRDGGNTLVRDTEEQTPFLYPGEATFSTRKKGKFI